MEESTPLVSVIIPTYNSQNTIKQCLESISGQTYKKIEILVVDRYSKDATTQIAKQFEAKVFPFKEERSEAKNYAAKKANDEFLLFIELIYDAYAMIALLEPNMMFMREIYKRWTLYDYELRRKPNS